MNNRITYVAIDTNLQILTKAAIDLSVRAFEPDDVIIFTNEPEKWLGYRTVNIEKFNSMKDYERVVLLLLPEYLNTDFCLIIHYDGFILNGNKFSNLYYDYDYIGAVWANHNYFKVGNGGFNWRSRKLIDNIPYYYNLLKPIDYEDVFICRTIRVLLEERHDISFASEDIASHFSFESVPSKWATFGFHGVMHLPNVYQNNLDFLLSNLSERFLLERKYLLYPGIEKLGPEAISKFNFYLNEV
jgi:hypothetical protein